VCHSVCVHAFVCAWGCGSHIRLRACLRVQMSFQPLMRRVFQNEEKDSCEKRIACLFLHTTIINNKTLVSNICTNTTGVANCGYLNLSWSKKKKASSFVNKVFFFSTCNFFLRSVLSDYTTRMKINLFLFLFLLLLVQYIRKKLLSCLYSMCVRLPRTFVQNNACAEDCYQ